MFNVDLSPQNRKKGKDVTMEVLYILHLGGISRAAPPKPHTH